MPGCLDRANASGLSQAPDSNVYSTLASTGSTPTAGDEGGGVYSTLASPSSHAVPEATYSVASAGATGAGTNQVIPEATYGVNNDVDLEPSTQVISEANYEETETGATRRRASTLHTNVNRDQAEAAITAHGWFFGALAGAAVHTTASIRATRTCCTISIAHSWLSCSKHPLTDGPFLYLVL